MNRPRLPGERIHALAARVFNVRVCCRLVEPAVADLQYEVREAGASRLRLVAALARGYAGCARVLVAALMSGGWPLKRAAPWLFGIVLAALSIRAGMHMTAAHVVFVCLFSFWLAPFVLVVWGLGGRWAPAQAGRLAWVVVPLWFVAGVAVGWACVPDIWPASLWLTIDATMGAAIYGDQFENLAERVMMYPLFVAVLAAAGASVASLAGMWLMRRRGEDSRPPAEPANG